MIGTYSSEDDDDDGDGKGNKGEMSGLSIKIRGTTEPSVLTSVLCLSSDHPRTSSLKTASQRDDKLRCIIRCAMFLLF